MIERRLFERFPSEKKFSLHDRATRENYEVFSHNISGGGVKVFLKSSLDPTHPLELYFGKLKSRKPKLKITSRLIWQKKTKDGWLAGIAFNPSISLMEVRLLLT